MHFKSGDKCFYCRIFESVDASFKRFTWLSNVPISLAILSSISLSFARLFVSSLRFVCGLLLAACSPKNLRYAIFVPGTVLLPDSSGNAANVSTESIALTSVYSGQDQAR